MKGRIQLYRTITGKIVLLDTPPDEADRKRMQPYELQDFEQETLEHLIDDILLPDKSPRFIKFVLGLASHQDHTVQAQLRMKLAEKLEMPVMELEKKFRIKKPENKQEPGIDFHDQNRIMSQYIFDPKKVSKRVPFTFCKLEGSGVAFGILLPKWQEVKKGNDVLGNRQVGDPVLITSNPGIYPCTLALENERNVTFESIPGELDLRWSLPSIKQHLEGNAPKINGLDLFNKIRGQYNKYMFYREDVWYDIHTLWDIGTYFHQLFFNYPLFELRGMQGTAKTKIMDISKLMTFNAGPVTVSPSAATLFRETHDKRFTKYIDEAEKLFTKGKFGQMESDERVELINSSYSSSGTVPRIEKVNERYKTVYYHVYSPTMLGSINGLYGATADRAIINTTTKAPDEDKRGELDPEADKHEKVWVEIKDSLYLYTLQNAEPIEKIYREFSEETGLKKRDQQIWKPLLSIALFLDKEIYERVLAMAKIQTDLKQMDVIKEGSRDHKILAAAYEVVKEKPERVYTKKIRERLFTMFPEEAEHKYPILERSISVKLDKLGFRNLRKKDNRGSYYELTTKSYEDIIKPFDPTFFASLASLPSPIQYNTIVNEEKLGDAKVTQMTQIGGNQQVLGDANDTNDASDGNIEVPTIKQQQESHTITYNIMMPCQECQAVPCKEVDGKFWCKNHGETGK